MLELIILTVLSRNIAARARGDGRNPTGAVVLLFTLWFLGSAGGLIFMLAGGSSLLLGYGVSYIGGIIGARLAFGIVGPDTSRAPPAAESWRGTARGRRWRLLAILAFLGAAAAAASTVALNGEAERNGVPERERFWQAVGGSLCALIFVGSGALLIGLSQPTRRRPRRSNVEGDRVPKAVLGLPDAAGKHPPSDPGESDSEEVPADSDSAPRFPLSAQIASLMWISVGSLVILGGCAGAVVAMRVKQVLPVAQNFAGVPAVAISVTFGIGFIVAGFRVAHGIASGTLATSALSLLIGLGYLWIAVNILALERTAPQAVPAEIWNRLTVLLRVGTVGSAVIGFGLIIAAGLGIYGWSGYRRWQTATYRLQRDSDRPDRGGTASHAAR